MAPSRRARPEARARAALLSGGASADGCLVVAKPAGPTSHDIVEEIRRIYGIRTGHAGTLDPMAQGVLAVFVGEGLKLLSFLPPEHLSKTYVARISLGAETDTYDATGAVTARFPLPPRLDDATIATALTALTGAIAQTPPAFSALKVDGRRAHELARSGSVVDLAPRPVTIHAATLLASRRVSADRHDLVVRIDCSRGTYIRSFARDLGQRLGTGGHLSYLLRERVGPWHLRQAMPFWQLRAGQTAPPASFVDLAALLPFPRAQVRADAARKLANGMKLRDTDVLTPPVDATDPCGHVQICADDGQLLAVYQHAPPRDHAEPGSITADWHLAPCRILADAMARWCPKAVLPADAPPTATAAALSWQPSLPGSSRIRVLDRTHPDIVQYGVLAIGVFDGVHRGHQQVIQQLHERGAALGTAAVVLTFDPPPRQLLEPDRFPGVITTLHEKADLLAAMGVEQVAIQPFSRALADMSAEAFIQGVVLDQFKPREVLVGFNFHFGAARAGSLDLLRDRLGESGVHLRVIARFAQDGHAVSSSRIRTDLAAGRLPEVIRGLGRPPAFTGIIVRGEQRGRKLGMPTANVSLIGQNKVLPPFGVYFATAAGATPGPWPAVVNIGISPTFAPREPLLEAHLLDFDADIYGRHLHIDLRRWHRPEAHFSSVGQLCEQMAVDLTAARAFFAREGVAVPPVVKY